MSTVTALTPRTGPAGVHRTVTGTGPRTVVLLHGFADNLTTWDRVVPALAAEHRVVAIDLPGFGRSTARWQAPLLDGYVDVVRRVLDAEGVTGPVALVGNSMGAVVAAMFAARYPARTDRVVLIDMPAWHSVPTLWGLAASRPAELGLRTVLGVVPGRVTRAGLGLAYGAIATADPRRVTAAVRDSFATPYAQAGRAADLVPIGRALVRELRTAGLADLVAGLTAPVLVVFGARDLLTPPRVVKHLRRTAAVEATVVIPDCGHCPQTDRPDALLAHVAPFLRTSVAVARTA